MQRLKFCIIGKVWWLIPIILIIVYYHAIYCYAQGPSSIGGAGSYDYQLSHAASVTLGTHYKHIRYAWDADGNLEYKGVSIAHRSITEPNWTIFRYYWATSGDLIEKRVREGLSWRERDIGW